MRGRISIAEARRRGWLPPEEKTKTGCSRKGEKKVSPSHVKLWDTLDVLWPGQAEWEYPVLLPERARAFKIDIAYPRESLAIEVDGFRYHAMFPQAFHRTLLRHNLLSVYGWTVLHFTHGEIMDDSTILKVIDIIGKKRTLMRK